MQSFGRYTLIRKVGSGGMAEIWKAKVQGPAGFEKILAIKRVLPHLVEESGSNFVEMFVEEAKLVAGLVHPNIVQVFDFGNAGKRDYFIAMEYVAGANLARVLHRVNQAGSRLPMACSLYIAAEACRGLGYAHVKTDLTGKPLGIVHRNVSPQNILISYTGEVKVTDFGIAKVASALSVTQEGHVRGKLAYMSPEQAKAEPLDARSDLFSLGVVLYEMLAGQRIFAGSASDAYARLSNFQGLDVNLLVPVPKELRSLLSSVMQSHRETRVQDAFTLEASIAATLGSGSLIEARHALATIVQQLFEDEMAMETSVEAVQSTESAAPHELMGSEGGEVPAVPHFSDSGTGLTPSRSQNPAARSQSGVTLVKSPAVIVDGATHFEGPTHIGQAPSEPRRRSTPLLVLGAAIAIAAGTLLATRWGKGGLEPPIAPPATTAPPPVTQAATPATPTTMPRSTATVRATAIPRPTARPSPSPTPTPVRVAVSRSSGFLSVNARPWVEVWVDGRRIAKETPVQAYTLPAGPHTIRFVNPALQFDEERRFTVPENGTLPVVIDVKARTIRLK